MISAIPLIPDGFQKLSKDRKQLEKAKTEVRDLCDVISEMQEDLQNLQMYMTGGGYGELVLYSYPVIFIISVILFLLFMLSFTISEMGFYFDFLEPKICSGAVVNSPMTQRTLILNPKKS